MGALVLCQQDQAGGLFVQAMDDARPLLAADPLNIRLITQHGIHERPGSVSRGRMHHHASRFIDNDQVLIFEDDIEGDILRDQAHRRGWRDSYRHPRTTFQRLTRFFGDAAVHIHKSTRDESLDARTRKLL